MLKIRLQRVGRKKQPHFRVVVTEHTNGPKSNKFIDIIGFRNPKTKEQSIDAEAAKVWIGKGAQLSDTVHNLFVKLGIIEGKTINVLPQKSPVVKEPTEEEKAAAAAAEAPAEETPAEEAAEAPAETTEEAAPAEEKEEPKTEEKQEEEQTEDK